MLQGYTLMGHTGLLPSYEAFLGVVATMMVQYSKFMKVGLETAWCRPCGSINYVETLTWARQEHNGFSHQNPLFIGSVLNLKPKLARVYLPPDANCFLSMIPHCLRCKNYINLMVSSKHPTPVWLSPEEADLVIHSPLCIAGVLIYLGSTLSQGCASVWKFASVDDGINPDDKSQCVSYFCLPCATCLISLQCSVLVGIGVEFNFEVIAAAALLKIHALAL